MIDLHTVSHVISRDMLADFSTSGFGKAAMDPMAQMDRVALMPELSELSITASGRKDDELIVMISALNADRSI